MAIQIGDVYHDPILDEDYVVVAATTPTEDGERWLVQPSNWPGPITMFEQAMDCFHRPEVEA